MSLEESTDGSGPPAPDRTDGDRTDAGREGPRRRELLALLAAAGTAGVPAASGQEAPPESGSRGGPADRARSTQEGRRIPARVEDVDGQLLTEDGRISRIEASMAAVPDANHPSESSAERDDEIFTIFEAIDGDAVGPTGGYARASDGRFEVEVPPATESGPDHYQYVFVHVRVLVDPPEGEPVEWFTQDTVPPDASSWTFTVDKRLLTDAEAPVSVWESVDPDDTDRPRSLYVESRGEIHRRRRNDDDEAEERGETDADTHLESGLVTLQTPEDVTVGYRTASTRAEHPLEPDGRYTDNIGEALLPATELGYVANTAGVPGSDGLGDGRPLYPAFHGDDRPYYRPYNDGREERSEERTEDLVFDLLNAALFVIGVVTSGGILAGVLLGTAGLALSQVKSGAVQGPADLPEWATEEGTTYVDGRLPNDRQAYDYVAGQWRWRTYGFVQRYPLTVENDLPTAFCVRGAIQQNRTDGTDGGKEALRVQQAFELDPTVRSPRDETGVPIPEGPVDDEIPDPTPRFDVSNWAPTAGDTVSFDASDSEAFGPLEVEEYRWLFVPPEDQDDQYDIDGDGGADLIGPGGFEEERTIASGVTVDEEFTVAGPHDVYLTAIDEAGNAATRQATLRVEEPPPPEIYPAATDAGPGDCFYPPTGERFPATGESAARHVGYGCGEWKSYEVVPGETYTVAVTVDGCHDCLLYDAAYAVDEPADPEADGPAADIEWAERARQEDPMGKARADGVLERTYVPETDRIRVRNLDGNAGWGFYVSVYGPRPSEDGDGDGGTGG